MSWKSFVAGYLTFSRKDRAGVLTLLLLIAVAFVLPYLAPKRAAVPIALPDSLAQMAATLPDKTPPDEDDYRTYAFDAPASTPVKGSLFRFNPNTLDDAGWQKLGLPARTIRTINNYRNKGGRFYKREDLARIWGLPAGFYERVKDYVDVPRDEQPEPASRYLAIGARPIEKAATPTAVDVNTADTAALVALPGIGPKLAARIINFRNKLGGFVSVDQVGTTYGLPDSTFHRIKGLLRISEGSITMLNINTATKEELSNHPYISWPLAGAIVNYRNQHGPFATIEDMQKIMILDEATWQRLRPYVSL